MQFAAKRLRRSDLTLFDVQYRRQNAGNQKAINLNRDVFIDLLFPFAPTATPGTTRFPCEVRVYGPRAIAEPRTVMRKVLAAAGTQKNWRLNGETILADPDAENPDRFDNIEEGDIAVFAFEGTVVPHTVSLLLLSQSEAVDTALFREFDRLIGGRRMIALRVEQLVPMLDLIEPTHPLREMFDPAFDIVAEEAAVGSPSALSLLRRRGVVRNTREALARALENFERIGRDGEGLVNEYLLQQIVAGRCTSAIWEAESNATHPFDFSAVFPSGNICIEVKSTSGDHERDVFVSQSEIEYAAAHSNVELWRISELSGGEGYLRRSSNFHALAVRLAELSGKGGNGIWPTGWSMPASALAPWSDPVHLTANSDDED